MTTLIAVSPSPGRITTTLAPTDGPAPNIKRTARDFLSRVVAWPIDKIGYVNVHYSMINPRGGKDIVTGKPFQDLDQLLGFCNWADQTNTIKELWYCTSLQSAVATNSKGGLKAVRLKANVLALKAIWVDIDVKDDAKHYKTITEAWTAITKFRDDNKLPQFSAAVSSGGGLHVYYISQTALDPATWSCFAEGFKALLIKDGIKCDPGLTTDCARILRIPGTKNHKYDPPRPVELMQLPPTDYDFPTELGALKKAAPPRSIPQAPPTLRLVGKPILPFDPNDCLSDGLEREQRLLDPAPIFKNCGFLQDALFNGGKNYQNPLWNLSLLCATFMENGNDLAHKMSKDHADYTVAETQEQYERKLSERKTRGIGYPSCATIQSDGCSACATCSHLEKGKSPLHLGLPANNPVNSVQAGQEKSGSGNWPHWPDPLDFHSVPEDEAIARINAAGYFVLTLNGDIYKMEFGGGVTVQKREGFNNLFASRRATMDDSTSTTAGTAWKNSPERKEYDRIGYWPGGSGAPSKSYNLWEGWGIEAKRGNWAIIQNHVLEVLACGDHAKANYILDWCAHMVQRPQEKPGVALVFRGRKGTGKSLLTLLVAAAIGRRNALITASGKKLFGNFNWHLADKLLIGAEEAFFVGNRELTDQLKHLLTGDDIEVEQKYGQRISMKSMHRMIMNSNHDQVISASDDERRFMVCDVSEARRGDDAYFAPLVSVIKGDDNATLAAFLYELQTRNVSEWKPERAAREAAKTSIDLARQKLLSLEPPLQWLLEQTLQAELVAKNTTEDVGYPSEADLDLDGRVRGKRAAEPARYADEQGTSREHQRAHMLREYRDWVKSAQVRGAGDFTSSEIFWASIKRLLNSEIFPGRRLFRSSGGNRLVILPSRHELLEGFNRLLGGNVVATQDDQIQEKQ